MSFEVVTSERNAKGASKSVRRVQQIHASTRSLSFQNLGHGGRGAIGTTYITTGRWVSEGVLWTRWIHKGALGTEEGGVLLALESLQFEEATLLYPQVMWMS